MQCMLVLRQTVGAGYKDKWNRPMNRTNQTFLSGSSDAPILVDGHIPVSTDLFPIGYRVCGNRLHMRAEETTNISNTTSVQDEANVGCDVFQ